ncbi:MAG TPA: LptA/OstA family protein, partial [Deinococcales bacterium]|nr:LptA/OstA family protein [Deinococcales bacterium]
MKKLTLAVLAMVAGLALAAENVRIINVKADKSTGNPRSGPLELSGNVRGTVQSLEITSPQGTLAAPEGATLAEATGKRIATFTGGVKVVRGRLNANGPTLSYNEASGLGVLNGPTKIVQKPAKEGDDEVNITAGKASFDVDTNVSTSTGDVKIVSGKQSGSAETVVFDEKLDLAVMKDNRTVSLLREPRKPGENALRINAKESRMLTGDKTLLATGGVTLVSGDTTTTGDELFYDDDTGIAVVVGRPAKSVSGKSGNSSGITSGAIQQNTRNNQVKQLGSYK